MKIALSIDWIQISVRIPSCTYVDKETGELLVDASNYVPQVPDKIYKVVQREIGGQYFKKIFDIKMIDDSELAVLEACPRVSFIEGNVGILKIANRVLYSENYYKIIESLLKDFDLTFNYFKRIDYAIDFKEFKSMSCVNFIQSHASGDIVIKGNSKITDNIQYISRFRKPNALVIGSRQSYSMATLYNKSLEMRQKKDKPWVRHHWELNGIDYSTDVWRLEISIKKSKGTFCVPSEKIEFGFDSFELIKPENINSLMQTLIDYKFSCAYADGNKQFCRLCKLDLLPDLSPAFFRSSVSRLKQGTTMVKHTVKKLLEACDNYRQVFETYSRCNNLVLHVKDIIKEHDLYFWLEKNFGNIDKYFASNRNMGIIKSS